MSSSLRKQVFRRDDAVYENGMPHDVGMNFADSDLFTIFAK